MPMNTSLADFLPRVGDRVELRRLTVSDLESFQAYRNDPDVGRYQGWSAMSPTDAAAFLARMHTADPGIEGEWFQLGIAERSSGGLIGDVGVCLRTIDDPHAEIGFTLAPAAQGQGLGSEAVRELLAALFEHSSVARVIAITDARNLPSVRLLRRIGMRLGDTFSSHFRGEPCTEHLFVIRRGERHSTCRIANAGGPNECTC